MFLASVTACGFGSFLFGYHVHEKAILIILVPLALAELLDISNLQAINDPPKALYSFATYHNGVGMYRNVAIIVYSPR